MMILGRVLVCSTLGLLLGISSASAVVTIDVVDTTGILGSTAVVDVDVVGLAADGPAGSLDFDLVVNGDVFDLGDTPDCEIQFPVNQASAFFPMAQPEPPSRRIRFSAADLQPDDPLSMDGTLWTCNFPVSADAALGDSEIVVENIAIFDELGLNELESEGVNGNVLIEEQPPFSPTPVPPTATNTPEPTNTARPTNTTAPTSTRPPGGGGDDDDGCQVVAPANSSAGWLLLIPAAALLWQRRRSR